MKTKSKNISQIVIFIIAITALLSGCAKFKHLNDAVRIKPDSAQYFNRNPFTGELRNGAALRGTVLKVQTVTTTTKCQPEKEFETRTYVLFVDSLNPFPRTQVERIPIEAVELAGLELPMNEQKNINLFESFNSSSNIQAIREVEMDDESIDTCDISCPCQPVDIGCITCWFDINCKGRSLPWYFLEIRGAYASYVDKKTVIETEGRKSFLGEVALGARLGEKREWGVGVALAYGLKTYNQYTQEDITRYMGLLHFRYQPYTTSCLRPFLYGQFGLTIDKLSMDLTKINMSNDCDETTLGMVPSGQLSMPISYGLGLGLDISISPIMDLSFDIGYRSVTFAETQIFNRKQVPTSRRVNMLILRAGITF